MYFKFLYFVHLTVAVGLSDMHLELKVVKISQILSSNFGSLESGNDSSSGENKQAIRQLQMYIRT